MTHLALQFLFGAEDFAMANGMWLFLSIGAIALFGIFLPITTWIDSRRKEREAFYKAETFRRVAEAPQTGGASALELLREQERMKAIKAREGIKIAGLVNFGVGIALVIFLKQLIPGNPPVYLCGLIPGFIGIAFLLYVYVLAAPVDRQ
jgi:hypothetical protein